MARAARVGVAVSRSICPAGPEELGTVTCARGAAGAGPALWRWLQGPSPPPTRRSKLRRTRPLRPDLVGRSRRRARSGAERLDYERARCTLPARWRSPVPRFAGRTPAADRRWQGAERPQSEPRTPPPDDAYFVTTLLPRRTGCSVSQRRVPSVLEAPSLVAKARGMTAFQGQTGGWERARDAETKRFRKPLLYPLSYGANLLESRPNLARLDFFRKPGAAHHRRGTLRRRARPLGASTCRMTAAAIRAKSPAMSTPSKLNPSVASTSADRIWEEEIVPALFEYIRIPNKSQAFDPAWREHGHMERAVMLIEGWCRKQPIAGLTVEVVRLGDRTPVILMEVPGKGDDTVLLYGHLGQAARDGRLARRPVALGAQCAKETSSTGAAARTMGTPPSPRSRRSGCSRSRRFLTPAASSSSKPARRAAAPICRRTSRSSPRALASPASSFASTPGVATTIRCGRPPRFVGSSAATSASRSSPKASTPARRAASSPRASASCASSSRASRTRPPGACSSRARRRDPRGPPRAGRGRGRRAR